MNTSLFLLTLFIFKAKTMTLLKNVSLFCANNGHRYVTVTFLEENLMKKEGQNMMKFLQERNIYSRIIEKNSKYIEFEQDTQVLITNLQTTLNTIEMKKIMKSIENHKIKKSILLLHPTLNETMEANLVESIRNSIESDAYFHVIFNVAEEETVILRTIFLRNSSKVLMHRRILDHYTTIAESYNMLEGLEIASITLPWAPYIIMKGCDKDGMQCKTDDFLTDMFDGIGRISNSTFTTHKQLDDNWGLQPVSGPFNKSGIWDGVFGKVVNNQYPISINTWVYTIERNSLVDMASISNSRTCLVLIPQIKGLDSGLFIRPFRNDAWLALGGMFIILFVTYMIPYKFINHFGKTSAQKLMALIGWILFVLVNAWYSGALTMFFTSEITIPFESIYDVMKAYPDWKLMTRPAYDIHFMSKVSQGDIDYVKFWKRVQENPEETLFDSVEEGMNKIYSGQFVIYLDRGQILGYIKANPDRNQRLKVFGCGQPYSTSVILPKNSPLKPILEFSARKLWESGTYEILIKNWFGETKYQSGGLSTTVLSGGQVILAFVILLSCLSLTIFTFILEVLYSKCILIKSIM